MSGELVFVDTNVLVYAYDFDAGRKHLEANRLLRELWNNNQGVLSVQVLQEFYVTITSKLTKPISDQTAREIIQTYLAWTVYSPSAQDILTASKIKQDNKLSFWDAMIIVAAQALGAKQLVTEDMQSGRSFRQLRIVNPFS